MKNRFLAIVALFLMSSGIYAQDSNKMDNAGKRDGLWKGSYETSKRPRYEGTFNHGKETGTFKFFEDNATSTLAATRVFAKDGSCYTTFFDEKGNKVGEGKEVNKVKEGEWKFYHPASAVVMAVENYSKGKLTGVRKTYFPSGKLAEEANYANGLKNGPYRQYTEKDIVLEESVYKDDKLQGPALYRNAHGEVTRKGQYADNKKTGIWQYFEKGKMVKQEDMTNLKVELARKERKN
jgi:antitoxin component YwqK of YwqJK toxin-antitoxin module